MPSDQTRISWWLHLQVFRGKIGWTGELLVDGFNQMSLFGGGYILSCFQFDEMQPEYCLLSYTQLIRTQSPYRENFEYY